MADIVPIRDTLPPIAQFLAEERGCVIPSLTRMLHLHSTLIANPKCDLVSPFLSGIFSAFANEVGRGAHTDGHNVELPFTFRG